MFFTINIGITNASTIMLLLKKLIEHLDHHKLEWKSNKIFMLDNASYKRSHKVKTSILNTGITCLFLVPYQFKMERIENLFAFIKSRNLIKKESRGKSR